MIEEIEVRAKKWGSSLGIIIPKALVEKEKIKPDDILHIVVHKAPTAKKLWDLGPVLEACSTQQIKEKLRRGW